jgi:lipoprotein-anchoring transpeptidase ErfK/SrfK
VDSKKPPLAPPLTPSPTNNVQSGSPAATPVAPYASSVPPVAASAAPPSAPAATLGATISPPTMSSSVSATTDTVRNLTPPPEVAAASGATVPASTPAPDNQSLLQSKFAAFMEAVQKSLEEGKLAEAHLALSSLYGNPDLPPEQAKQITDLLDRLAGTVIYSQKHYLEPPYMTKPGDTLDGIANRYSIPWQLLGRINGLVPPGPIATENPLKDQPLPPGKELKVVRGPFEAVVSLEKHELTLMLQKRYAGRFPIGVGRDEPKLDGEYTIRDKTPSPAYHGPDGLSLNPNDPQNPLGGAWIGLTDRIGIHGTNNPQAIGRDDNRGAICVGDRDLQDLYGILSVGSRVTILR